MHLISIAIKRAKRMPLDVVANAQVTVDGGMTGDVRGAGGPERKRQITIVNMNQWLDACDELRADMPWYTRRANLLVDMPPLGPHLVGRFLRFPKTGVVLEVTGETKPCARMDEIRPGLQAALTPDWRGGITCRVVTGGMLTGNLRFVLA